MNIEINGEKVKSEVDFHIEISKKLNFPSYYGKNLDALWDILSSDVERPIVLTWKNALISKEKMGIEYDKICNVLKRVAQQNKDWNLDDKFEFLMEI